MNENVAILNKEEDIAAYTMRAVDDPGTLNKSLYINPPKNIVSQNDIVALWESKIGKSLEKSFVSEEELLKKIPGEIEINSTIFHNTYEQSKSLCWLIIILLKRCCMQSLHIHLIFCWL